MLEDFIKKKKSVLPDSFGGLDHLAILGPLSPFQCLAGVEWRLPAPSDACDSPLSTATLCPLCLKPFRLPIGFKIQTNPLSMAHKACMARLLSTFPTSSCARNNNSKHTYSAKPVPGSFNPHDSPEGKVLLLSSLYKWGKWGTEKSSNLSNNTQLGRAGAGI